MDVSLRAAELTKTYGAFHALKGVSLQLVQGEILALLGPNGAGKTTLIKILATLLNKDGGRVEIFGLDLDRQVEEIRHLIGYVGQDTERSAYARLTAWENLAFFAALRGLSTRQTREQVEKLAHYFEFHNVLQQQFGTLSGGQKQTVVIMRALLHDPPVVFLDEPTKGLDPIIARRIRAFLKKYVHEQTKSMLLTSHVLSEVEILADRVALIQGGQIATAGTAQELKNSLGAQEFVELEKARLPDHILRQVDALPEVTCRMEREPGWISFGVREPLAGAAAILQVLQKTGAQTSFRHHSATLEDAFLHHTGALSERFDA
jgi:ABC-2 type transport system ATP-binding protein